MKGLHRLFLLQAGGETSCFGISERQCCGVFVLPSVGENVPFFSLWSSLATAFLHLWVDEGSEVGRCGKRFAVHVLHLFPSLCRDAASLAAAVVLAGSAFQVSFPFERSDYFRGIRTSKPHLVGYFASEEALLVCEHTQQHELVDVHAECGFQCSFKFHYCAKDVVHLVYAVVVHTFFVCCLTSKEFLLSFVRVRLLGAHLPTWLACLPLVRTAAMVWNVC